MWVLTKHMCFENCWTISRSHDFRAHQQHFQRRCSVSLPGQQQFEMLTGLSPAFPGALKILTGASWHAVCTSRLLARISSCSPCCRQKSYAVADFLADRPTAPACQCISPVTSGILPPCDSGQTTLKHSKRFPVTTVHSTDEGVVNHHCVWQHEMMDITGQYSGRCHSYLQHTQSHSNYYHIPFRVNIGWLLARSLSMSTNRSPQRTTNMAPSRHIFGSQHLPYNNLGLFNTISQTATSTDSAFGQHTNQFHPLQGYGCPPSQQPFTGAP